MSEIISCDPSTDPSYPPSGIDTIYTGTGGFTLTVSGRISEPIIADPSWEVTVSVLLQRSGGTGRLFVGSETITVIPGEHSFEVSSQLDDPSSVFSPLQVGDYDIIVEVLSKTGDDEESCGVLHIRDGENHIEDNTTENINVEGVDGNVHVEIFISNNSDLAGRYRILTTLDMPGGFVSDSSETEIPPGQTGGPIVQFENLDLDVGELMTVEGCFEITNVEVV